MRQETDKQIFARIERTNARFAKLSKARQRVAVAQDALDLIASGFMGQAYGYLHIDGYLTPEQLKQDMSKVIPQLSGCNVCAKGGIMVTCLLRKNKLKAKAILTGGRGVSGYDVEDYVVDKQRLFSRKQFDLIEERFECSQNENQTEFAPDVYNRVQRLKMVFQNIVVNKGTFKPSLQPKQLSSGEWRIPGYREPRPRKG
jgi:hypothetical protein